MPLTLSEAELLRNTLSMYPPGPHPFSVSSFELVSLDVDPSASPSVAPQESERHRKSRSRSPRRSALVAGYEFREVHYESGVALSTKPSEAVSDGKDAQPASSDGVSGLGSTSTDGWKR